jgi:GNAT superfamily N-acetyltransferase
MEKATVQLRDALPQEAALILDVWRLAYNQDDLPGELADVLRVMTAGSHARLFVATVDDVIIGTLIATFDGWRGNMYRIAVLPEHRRRGIAFRLVKEAEAWLTSLGCWRITSLVDKTHPWATGFWGGAGYEQDFMGRFFHNLQTRTGWHDGKSRAAPPSRACAAIPETWFIFQGCSFCASERRLLATDI